MKFIRRDADKGYVDSMMYVPKIAVNVEGVKNALTFTLENKMNEVRYLELYKETDLHLVVPRAFWHAEDMNFDVVDCRPEAYEVQDIQSNMILDAKFPHRTTQKDAVSAILASSGGILQLACGLGKTCVALHVAALLKVPTLVVVNTTNLVNQWTDEVRKHLVLPGGVGLIQADSFDWKKSIVMATYQTLASKADVFPEEARRWFGLIVFDEAHHVAAPTFCRAADLFYGMRLGLTATAERADGAHVVYNVHIGKVLYKDLRQELTPKFEFIWTGISIDTNNKKVHKEVMDKKGELHLGKLEGYLGTRKDRLDKILELVRGHEKNGRKVMVLSTSVAELVNLFSTYNGGTPTLYSDIPEPTEVGLSRKARARYELELKRNQVALLDSKLNATKRQQIKEKIIPLIRKKLEKDDATKKTAREYAAAQREYVRAEVEKNSDAGLMIAKVPPATRMQMLKTKRVIFAIYQYGLEGLDDENLDTVIACIPMTSKGPIQQFVGRILRKRAGKKEPLVQFLEDNIGPVIGMCKTVRYQLRNWPVDEGGPYSYDMVDNPHVARRTPWKRTPRIGH